MSDLLKHEGSHGVSMLVFVRHSNTRGSKKKKKNEPTLRATNQSSFPARAQKKKSARTRASIKRSPTQRQRRAFKNNTTHSAHGHVDTDMAPTGVRFCTRSPEERPMARGREARLTTKLCSCRGNTHTHTHTHTWSGLGQKPSQGQARCSSEPHPERRDTCCRLCYSDTEVSAHTPSKQTIHPGNTAAVKDSVSWVFTSFMRINLLSAANHSTLTNSRALQPHG